VLTNTLSVAVASNALVRHTLQLKENESVASVNAVVGETNDRWLNDIRGMYLTEEHVLKAISTARVGAVEEGAVGAGTGTICFGFKGGIGTSSRKIPTKLGGWTVGVLVQTNFGGVLQINGAPVGRELNRFYLQGQLSSQESGSCMIVVATDAPLLHRNLERLARRAVLGLARTGGFCSNGSGDYVIAFSNYPTNRVHSGSRAQVLDLKEAPNRAMSPLFLAVVEATEEAVLNSLFQATTMVGRDGLRIDALPIPQVLKICDKYNIRWWGRRLSPHNRQSPQPGKNEPE